MRNLHFERNFDTSGSAPLSTCTISGIGTPTESSRFPVGSRNTSKPRREIRSRRRCNIIHWQNKSEMHGGRLRRLIWQARDGTEKVGVRTINKLQGPSARIASIIRTDWQSGANFHTRFRETQNLVGPRQIRDLPRTTSQEGSFEFATDDYNEDNGSDPGPRSHLSITRRTITVTVLEKTHKHRCYVE